MIRVIWRYSSRLMGGPREPAPSPDEIRTFAVRRLDDFDTVSGAEPVFSVPGTVLRTEALRHSRDLAMVDRPVHDLANYSHAFFEDEEEATAAIERLRNDPDVEWAEIQHRLTRPVWRDPESSHQPESTSLATVPLAEIDDFTPRQRYLEAGPRGIDARFAWGIPGGKGDGAFVFDIEVGWDFQHEDLRRKLVGLVHGSNPNNEDHGTAVLGIVGGDHNGTGVSGIAPEAVCATAGVEWNPGLAKWNQEDAILHVVRSAKPGSVILLELQGAWPGPFDYVPVELWQSTLDVITLATSSGFLVVEAAGNGGLDLDAAPYKEYFDRHLTDSGAILVGSADPEDLSRLTHSNFGSCVDVQAWGKDVVTTGGNRESGYSDLHHDTVTSRCYTKSFGGTSSASAIIAGSAACVQGALLEAGRPPLSSIEMRDHLVRTGTRPGTTEAESETIGPRPDLRRALLELQLHP